MSGLQERLQADYEPVLLVASYEAFLRGEVEEGHMLDVLLPVIGAVLLREYRNLSRFDQSDLVSSAIEAVMLELHRIRNGRPHIESPLTYFYAVVRNQMLRTLPSIRTHSVFTNGTLPTSKVRGFEDADNDLMLVQLSVLGYRYCMSHIRFRAEEREICGYALSKIMSGSKPSVAYLGRRYGISDHRARFFTDYATVLYRMAKSRVQQEVV